MSLLEKVELAILANGGFAHKKAMCSCDPSVGMSPCEYCAIHCALDGCFRLLSSQVLTGKVKQPNETSPT